MIGDGKGTFGDPNAGKDAAIAAEEHIEDVLRESDILVISACMGGGTGTGASYVIAEIAHDMGIPTVGVATLPFKLEGRRRSDVAAAGVEFLKDSADALLVIPNDRLSATTDREGSLYEMFSKADDVLLSAVQSIIDAIKASGAGGSNVTELIKTIEESAAKI